MQKGVVGGGVVRPWGGALVGEKGRWDDWGQVVVGWLEPRGGEVVGAQGWWGPMNCYFAKKGMQLQLW